MEIVLGRVSVAPLRETAIQSRLKGVRRIVPAWEVQQATTLAWADRLSSSA